MRFAVFTRQESKKRMHVPLTKRTFDERTKDFVLSLGVINLEQSVGKKITSFEDALSHIFLDNILYSSYHDLLWAYNNFCLPSGTFAFLKWLFLTELSKTSSITARLRFDHSHTIMKKNIMYNCETVNCCASVFKTFYGREATVKTQKEGKETEKRTRIFRIYRSISCGSCAGFVQFERKGAREFLLQFNCVICKLIKVFFSFFCSEVEFRDSRRCFNSSIFFIVFFQVNKIFSS